MVDILHPEVNDLVGKKKNRKGSFKNVSEYSQKLERFNMFGKTPDQIFLEKISTKQIRKNAYDPINPYLLEVSSSNQDAIEIYANFTQKKYSKIIKKQNELLNQYTSDPEMHFLFLKALRIERKFKDYTDLLFLSRKKFLNHAGIRYEFAIFLYHQSLKKDIDWDRFNIILQDILRLRPKDKFVICLKAKALMKKGESFVDLIKSNNLYTEPFFTSIFPKKNENDDFIDKRNHQTDAEIYRKNDSPYLNKHHEYRDKNGRFLSNSSYDDMDN